MVADKAKQLHFTALTQVSTSNISVPNIIRDPSQSLDGYCPWHPDWTLSTWKNPTKKELKDLWRAEADRKTIAAHVLQQVPFWLKTVLLKPTLNFPYHKSCNSALSCKMTPFPLETICKSDTSEINTV